MTKSFVRDTTRSIGISQGFSVIVAIAGSGESLKHFYEHERESGKICIVLSEKSSADLNTDSIALADELLVLNLSGELSSFQTAMVFTAQNLDKHIRFLRD